ncbi:biotin--[acetyl-CoA-carboxylase] ligase [Bartonella sp. DGB1]|uniref:biotin--[acetyl-CoA-carboxylase] ligase n=1 Tax=Bartonella sp. DGB1 TaxID=3239807 RepID=UPI0035233C4A
MSNSSMLSNTDKILQLGYSLLYVDQTSSTMDLAFEQYDLKSKLPLWVVADKQTSGRGRFGNQWHDSGNNLSVTLALSTNVAIDKISLLGFVAGIALVDTIKLILSKNNIANFGDIKLKYPNDVLIDGKKISGILLETRTDDIGYKVALGIGVNIGSFPEKMPYLVSCLNDLYNINIHMNEFFIVLAEQWAYYFDKFNLEHDLEWLRVKWQEYAFAVGEKILLNGDSLLFKGINQDFLPILIDKNKNVIIYKSGNLDWSPVRK